MLVGGQHLAAQWVTGESEGWGRELEAWIATLMQPSTPTQSATGVAGACRCDVNAAVAMPCSTIYPNSYLVAYCCRAVLSLCNHLQQPKAGVIRHSRARLPAPLRAAAPAQAAPGSCRRLAPRCRPASSCRRRPAPGGRGRSTRTRRLDQQHDADRRWPCTARCLRPAPASAAWQGRGAKLAPHRHQAKVYSVRLPLQT